MNAAVLTQVVITIGLIASAFLGGVFSRRTRHVTAEVTLSVEAREWAKTFEDRARQAEARAERAEEAAREATRNAQRLADRMDLLETHVEKLEGIMRTEGLEPPPRPFRSQ
jgi:hypothetical protein